MKTIYTKLFFFLLLLPLGVVAQGTLSGTVLDKASGQPLPGVSIVVEGSNNGTSTDFDGRFTLTNVTQGQTVVFSYVGYRNETVKYTGQSDITVSMEEDVTQLSEVVVQVGYGTVKRQDATGSVTTVTARDFNRGAIVTTENLLNGKVAGLTINTSGAPGSGSEIRIRGGSSLFASNDPLIVIDGLPIENNTNTGSTSFLASLNPATIESVTVLKDASATAIYGSRAANGVIIITTKSGGKALSVDYNFQYGSGKHVKTVDVFSAAQFRSMMEQYYPGSVGMLGTANTNWQEEIYRRTDFVDNNLSVRGNLFGFIPSRLTLGNTYQEGLRLTNQFTRNAIGASLNPSFFDNHLKFRVNANFTHESNRFAPGVEGGAISFDPTQPVYDPESPFGGFFEFGNGLNSDGYPTILQLAPRNPVAQLLQTNDHGENRRFFGNFEVDYKFHFFPDLRAVLNLGFDEADGYRHKEVPGFIAASGSTRNDVPFGNNEYDQEVRRNKLLDFYLVYNKKFGNMDLDLTAGYSYQKFERWQRQSGNQNDSQLPENFPETNIDTDVVLIGFFARANLNFYDKYLLTLSMRRDGSSRFSEDNRWGNFPAVAFAWKLREDFFKDSNTLSDLKLRLGWGITGQQNFSAANSYLQTYITGNGVSQYYFGPTPYPIAVSDRLSPDIKWEETTTYNVGLDFGFWNNRLSATVDAFYKVSDDLIVDAAVSDGSNFSNRAWQNVGSFTTKGIEIGINGAVVRNDNFTWNLNLNFTKYERRIDELIYNQDIFVGPQIAGTGTNAQIYREGFTPYSFYVYKQLYDPSGQPIEGAYADLNGDGIINESDKYIYENPDPDFLIGFGSSMTYKNWDFSFNMRASIGNENFNQVNASRAQIAQLLPNGYPQNVPTQVLSTNFNVQSDVILSDIWIEDASYLRMDNITLGYTFPKWIDGKASLRLSVGVQNAFVITDYSGLDPEITNNGVDATIYPRQRQWLFGANIKF